MTDGNCPMKIGTDGVLLGAWFDIGSARTVLDVGTGCGLIALMLAQRFPQAHITGIDLHLGAQMDAEENFRNSPFNARLTALRGDFLTYPFTGRYEAIVSNPPFFTEDTLPPDTARAAARNAVHLPLEALAQRIAWLLTSEGRAGIVYPFRSAEQAVRIFAENGLHLVRRTDIKSTEHKTPKRSLLCFSRIRLCEPTRDTLCLCDAFGKRSEQYRRLTEEFHP